MKKLTTIIALLLCAASLFAQVPEKFTYQAVVRNVSNSLVANAQVGVRVSILQGSASGSAVYVETHNANTNANGLLTVEIGGGSVQQGTFADVDWSNGPFFLKTETDPNGGTSYSVTTTQQLLSVPYALYAKEAGNAFSGDYNDLTNTPVIPTVPTNVSAFTNDVPYLTIEQQILTISNDTIFLSGGSFVKLPAGFSGSWNDLTDKPEIPEVTEIPEVPDNISAFTNDANYVSNTACADVDLCVLAAALSQLQALVQEQQQRIEDLETQIGTPDTTTIPVDTTTTQDGQPCQGVPTVTDYDGNVYNTVKIGEQCWMKENLRTTHYSDGTAIPEGTTTSSSPYYYDYSNSNLTLTERGYLYNWPAVMHGASSSLANPSGVQGVCPTGWHVPSDAEWTELEDYVGGRSEYACGIYTSYSIAKALAATAGWNTNSETCAVGNSQSTNNATGFGAFPAGQYLDVANIGYAQSGHRTYFWTSTEDSYSNNFVWTRSLYDNDPGLKIIIAEASHALSVRCLRDDSITTFTNHTVTTYPATHVTETSAMLHGSHSNSLTIQDEGFEWKATEGGTYTQVGANGLNTTMTYALTGLMANTSYTYRTFAIYGGTTTYGEEVTFTTLAAAVPVGGQPCPGALTVTDYDGNVYNTVQIGDQCWMKENLRTTHYSDGTTIPVDTTTSSSSPYYYDYSISNLTLTERGYLYNWSAVMHGASGSQTNPSGVQGICPIGWHVPSDAEWSELKDYVNSQGQYLCNYSLNCIAKALASTTGWSTSSYTCAVGNNQSSNNATGFGAFPAGYYYGDYYDSGSYACFWSATEDSTGNAWQHALINDSISMSRGSINESVGFSVRCLRD